MNVVSPGLRQDTVIREFINLNHHPSGLIISANYVFDAVQVYYQNILKVIFLLSYFKRWFMRLSLFSFFRLIISSFALLSLAGCTNHAMNYAIESWKNQPVSQVIAEWGTPSEELRVSGNHLFIWNSYDGVLASPLSPRRPDIPDSRYCMRLLEVDSADKVKSGAWEGKDCPGIFSGWSR